METGWVNGDNEPGAVIEDEGAEITELVRCDSIVSAVAATPAEGGGVCTYNINQNTFAV